MSEFPPLWDWGNLNWDWVNRELNLKNQKKEKTFSSSISTGSHADTFGLFAQVLSSPPLRFILQPILDYPPGKEENCPGTPDPKGPLMP